MPPIDRFFRNIPLGPRGAPSAPQAPTPAVTPAAVPAAPTPAATPAAGAIPASAPSPTAGSAAAALAGDAALREAGVADLQALRGGLSAALSRVPAPPATAVATASTTAPRIERLYQDPAFGQLHAFATGKLAQAQAEQRGWDQLWHVRNFSAALDFVLKGTPLPGTPLPGAPVAGGAVGATGATGATGVEAPAPLFERFPGVQERRALCHLLMLLMPEAERSERPLLRDGSRGPPQGLFEPLPNAIVARADDHFALRPGDLPRVAPVFTAHLQRADLLDQIFRPGQGGTFLASKRFCPGAFLQDRRDIYPAGGDKRQQAGHEGDPLFVKIDDIRMVDGQKFAKVHIEPQYKQWMGDHGGSVQGHEVLGRIDHVLDVEGKPVLGPEGKPQDILVPLSHLADYLLDPGQGTGARGLDLSSPDDRAIALCYTHELKQRYLTDAQGTTRSLFAWLEEAGPHTARHDLDRIRQEVRDAAWHAVAKHACHPRRTHFKIELGGEAWQREAYDLLKSSGIMQDCGNRYATDKDSTRHQHQMAWTSHFLERGFVGGSLDCYGLADAFDKLQATFLAPLGILTTTDLAEGHGSEVVRILQQPDESGLIQAGELYKSKLNEMITAVDVRISSGRGPAAQYMENWPGYLKIKGPSGKRIDLAQAQARMAALVDAAGSAGTAGTEGVPS